MDRAQVAAARQAALARLRGTRRNPDAGHTEAERRQAWAEGRELPRLDLYGPQWKPPAVPAEFFDDRVIEWGRLGFAETPVMVTIAAAGRDGAAAAVQAVRAAREVAPAVAWNVFQNMERWRAHDDAVRTGADRVVAAMLGEWGRLRLPEADPAPKERRRRQRPWEIEAEAS